MLGSLCLCRQGLIILKRHPDPFGKCGLHLDAGRRYENKALHGFAGELHGFGVGQGHGFGVQLGSHSENNIFLERPAAHVPAHHKAKAAEHLDLTYRPVLDILPDPLCQTFVVRPRFYSSSSLFINSSIWDTMLLGTAYFSKVSREAAWKLSTDSLW